MQIEILGPDNVVHYRRPHYHPMVLEALAACQYSVFYPGVCDMSLLPTLPQGTYKIDMTEAGMRVHSRKQ